MDMEWAENVTLHSGVRNGAEALALFEEDPGDLEIFDYLSALPHGKHGREREISDFMWGWTRHVQEHNVAAVALAQIKGTVSERGLSKFLNDQRWNRDDKKQPNIDMFRAYDHEDLVWCSDAGRNAKELGFMFRPGRVLKRPQINWSGAKDDVMEFDFPKRNWGAEGRIRVGIDIKTARFFDLPEKDPTQQKDDDGK